MIWDAAEDGPAAAGACAADASSEDGLDPSVVGLSPAGDSTTGAGGGDGLAAAAKYAAEGRHSASVV